MDAEDHGSTGTGHERRQTHGRPTRAASARSRPPARRRGPHAPAAIVATLRRTIFALCRQYDIDDDLRHELQLDVTGKASIRTMTVTEMQAVIDRLAGKNVWTPRAQMVRLAAQIDDGTVRLRAFCWTRFSKEPEDLDAREVRSCISFLRNIRKKEGGPQSGK